MNIIAYILLFILSLFLLKTFLVRKNQSKKESINFFLTLHRLFIQRKKIQIEDLIVFASVGFIFVFSYIFLNLNFTISVEKEVEAETKFQPEISQEENKIDSLSVDAKTEIKEDKELNFTFINIYEESDFDSIPAKIKSEIQWEAEDFFLPTGEIKSDPSSSSKKTVTASKEVAEAGDLAISDPTTLQPAGKFEVNFFVKTEDNKTSKEVLQIAVIDEHENKVLFRKNIHGNDFKSNGEYEAFGGIYERKNIGSVQFKVFFSDAASVAFDKVEVKPISIEKTYEIDHDFYKTLTDKSTDNGFVKSALMNLDIPGRLAFGPYAKGISAGKYRADFYLKVSDNSRVENIALIDVASDAKDFHSVYRFLAPIDFNEKQVFQKFSLDFEKPEEGYLEFRIYYYGVGDLFFDKVELFSINEEI